MIARRRVRHDDEDGFVLPVVMGIALVMLVVISTSLAVAGSGYTKAARDADYSAALSAAYAGLADYQSRLSNDSRYVTYGNPSSAFTSASSSSVTLPTQAANPAFGNSETDDWALIPGSEQGAAYRYEVDNSKYASQGVLRLRVTGKVGQVTRSIVADMRQNGFLSYVYFTDYETQDPAFGNYAECERYAYDGRASRCLEIEFGNDTLTGPVHSNDRIRACATTFGDKVTTSSPGGAWTQSSCGANTWKAGLPSYVNRVDIPATNSEMKKETRSDLPGDVPRPGCLYTGPTSITYNGNGTMTIQSPWTKFTNTTESGAGTNPARCGSPARLASSAGATVDVLDGNLIYVQNVPAAGSNDPNANTGYPSNFSCTTKQNVKDASSSDNDFEGWSYYSTRYPVADEVRPDFTSNAAGKKAYGCLSGDVFVKGQVKGATTLAAENFVYITGDLTYVDRSRDVLGIVGNNSVWVWNPRGVSGALYSTKNRSIDAAIMSVAHTFTVQNYNRGPQRGTLNVFGSIAQKFRGPVRQNGGYSKNYVYDTRLKSIAPPKFITPVSTTYDTLRAGGVAAAFDSNGKAL